MIKISVGWKNSEGYSENQSKSFDSAEQAFDFCKKHMNNIIRINGTRFHRDFEDATLNSPEERPISDLEILNAIQESI